jgi:Flp pilus assembly protein TadD
MDPQFPLERWAELDRLFAEALELPEEARAAHVERIRADDPALASEVLALLRAEQGSRDYLGAEANAPVGRMLRELVEGAAGEEACAAPERIGRYRVVGELGRGGWGTVYRAVRDAGDFEQTVAIKVLRRGLDTDDVLARFRAERQILASFEHPHIARLVDGGSTGDGRPYLVMEHVEGEPITAHCERLHLPAEARLRLFLQVASAVQYAHEQGVLHRDLKPSNILVDGAGRVRLLDFGIAKMLDETRGAAVRTRTGMRLLTPEYAAPEQLDGGALGPPTDVYQLGMLLYELLTGHRPRAAEGGPAPRQGRALRGETGTVVRSALHAEPERRYATAAALMEDVERVLGRRRIVARPDGWPRRAMRAVTRHRRHAAAAAGLALLLALLATAMSRSPASAGRLPVLAVASVEAVPGDSAAVSLALVLADLLSVGLAQLPELEVVGSARIRELAAAEPAGADPVAAGRDAGARAGATRIVEATLHPADGGGALRMEVRLVGVRDRRAGRRITVEGSDVYALAEGAVREIARELRLRPPALRLAELTTTSLVAYRFYEEGLRAYYDGDNRTSQRLLTAALAEDSAFPMALYYRALTSHRVDDAAFRADLGRAVRHAERTSGLERLLIRNAWARFMDEPARLALAETLVARHPTEPDGPLFLGEALLWSGDFGGALPHLRRAVAMDSLSLRGESPRCRACDALLATATAYMLADSLPAAEREAREWVRLQPGSARAWQTLASTLEYQGRLDEARAARGRAAAGRSDNPRDALYPAVLALRAGDFPTAERLLAEPVGVAGSLVEQNALWYRSLAARYRGRHDHALAAARAYRQIVGTASVAGHPPIWAAVLEAQVLFEMGRPREAAALWREIAGVEYEPDSPARTARHRAWTLTQAATALAAAGDTAALPALADTIRSLGAQSAYGRDPRLHHYVRGLHLMAGGDTVAAATELRRAIFSSTSGYGRVNLELGRALLAMGRPGEAVEVLGAALRGPLDAGNLYVNRTAIHALLARAHRAAANSDSAEAHERWVRRATAPRISPRGR